MAREETQPKVNRRKFLAGVAVAGAASAVTPPNGTAAATSSVGASAPRPSVLPPSAAVAAAESTIPKELPRAHGSDGSDFMVDVIKTLDIEYLPSNPASSFRGLHESLINYGGNKKARIITCTPEATAGTMGHGDFEVTGKAMLARC